MWCRSSTSLLRVQSGKKENVRSPANPATLVVRKKITHTFPQSHIPGPDCDLQFATRSCFSSLTDEICFVY